MANGVAMTETMAMMRAVRLHEIGGPQNLRVEDVPTPMPGAGEVVVRVRAAALNRRDLYITQGLYPGIALPALLGSDGAGEVAALGDDLAAQRIAQASLSVGDAVVIDPMLDWGDDLHAWDARGSSVLGMPRPGTFAQFVTVPAANVYRKPSHLSWEAAAALPLAGLTAYRALVTRGGIRAGETVLIPGVGGGVQTFVLLFAKALGARAIVTSGSDEKLERARALGADVVLNYRTDADWHKAARKAGSIDLVVDSSGGDTLAKALDAVRPGGRIAIYGGTTAQATIKLFPLFWKHVSILGTSMGSSADFRAMLELVERHRIEPVVGEVFPLDAVATAAERLASSSQFGKIVLRIPD